MWALDGSEPILGSGKQKYQESHTKVSQVYEAIHMACQL
ncbi:Phenylacetate-CoA oxygenase [Burkholderia multivorans]